MTIAIHTRIIEAPVAEAWRAIADYPHVDSYHPGVEHVSMLSDSQRGVGTARICHFSGIVALSSAKSVNTRGARSPLRSGAPDASGLARRHTTVDHEL